MVGNHLQAGHTAGHDLGKEEREGGSLQPVPWQPSSESQALKARSSHMSPDPGVRGQKMLPGHYRV